jgi:hypothetical protein
MTAFTLNLSGAFTITTRGMDITTKDMGVLSEAIVGKIFDYGLGQVLSDAGSGAAMAAIREKFGDKATGKDTAHKTWLGSDAGMEAARKHARAMVEKRADALWRGEWAVRASSGGASEETRVQRQIARQALKGAWGKDSADWKAFEGLGAVEQNAKLDDVFAKNEARFAPAVKDKLEQLRAERERNANLAVDLVL